MTIEQVTLDNKKVIETTKYKGKMRIVGVIINDNDDTIGYLIMNEMTYQLKPFTVEQTLCLIKQFGFVNATIEHDKDIVNTECSMSRLTKFDNKLNVVGNQGVYVIARLFKDNKKIGYKILGLNGKVVNIEEDKLKALINKNSIMNKNYIINAKIVTREGTNETYISAIKQEFTEIHIDYDTKNKSCNGKSKYGIIRYERRKNNLEEYLRKIVCNLYDIDFKSEFNTNKAKLFACRNKLTITEDLKTILEIARDNNIAEDEIEYMNKIIEDYKLNENTNDDYHRGLNNSQEALFIKLALVLNKVKTKDIKVFKNKDEMELINTSIKIVNNEYNKTFFEMCKNYGNKYMQIDNYEYMIKTANEILKDALNKNIIKSKEMASQLCHYKYDFKSARGIAELGFAVVEKNSGYAYTTHTGRVVKLKYIGKWVNNYNKYFAMASSFGDIAVLAQIGRTLEMTCFTEEEKMARVEIMLAIMSMYRPDIVNEYLNEGIIDRQKVLPMLDLAKVVDYKLSENIKLYYESGFNVFLNLKNLKKHNRLKGFRNNENSINYIENDYRGEQTRKVIRVWSKVNINYRGFRAGFDIDSMELKDMLGGVVGAITSENCTSELITRTIGRLRVL